MKENIPFSPPYIDSDVIDEVKDALTSGWITTGPKVKQLEDEISKLTGIENVLCLNSATSGLMLTLKWFGVGAGDEVIIPAYTYCATALAVYHVGAKPVIVDVRDDFNIDPGVIRKAITKNTKAIIPVDIAGWPADYNAINSIVEKKDVNCLFKPDSEEQKRLGRILIISDAAHSLGAKYKGKPVGQTADITVFSLHAVKNVTSAEGGAICMNLPGEFDNTELYNLMRLMSLNGQTKDAFTKTKAGGWRYDIVLPGFKMNMPDVCAAIGLAQMRKYKNQLLSDRKRIAELYFESFQKYEWAQLPNLELENSITSYHIFPLRIKAINENARDLIINEITKHSVAVNVHFIPLPMLSIFKKMDYKIDDFPIAYDNYSREISLPIYPQLTNDQIKYIIKAVVSSYSKIIND